MGLIRTSFDSIEPTQYANPESRVQDANLHVAPGESGKGLFLSRRDWQEDVTLNTAGLSW